MQKILRAALPFIVGSMRPLLGHCSSVSPAARLIGFGTYGNGNVWVTLDQALDQPGCPRSTIELPAGGAVKQDRADGRLAGDGDRRHRFRPSRWLHDPDIARSNVHRGQRQHRVRHQQILITRPEPT